MNFSNAYFEKAFGTFEQLGVSDLPEFCFSGRSNVGKSSLINKLTNRKALARVSGKPGKTVTINFYRADNLRIVDLPGYGYAKVSKEEKQKWAKLLETFLATEKLDLIISLVDIRHDPTEDDRMMINFLYHYQMPFVIVATKGDKLPKTKIKPQLQNIATKLRVGIADITASSADTGLGKAEIFSLIEKAISIKE